MAFIPGRRRKKQAKPREMVASRRVESEGVDDLDWLDESNQNDAFLTHRESLQSASNTPLEISSGRKRKCCILRDNHILSSNAASSSEEAGDGFNLSPPNLLYLREIGGFGRTIPHTSITGRHLIGRLSRNTWQSLLLRKRSPSPSNCIDDDSTSDSDHLDSQWMLDYSPPIYNIQYFHNSTDSKACLHRQTWRKKQVIPFSKLKTPVTDAILGISKSGGYLIGIGGADSMTRRDIPRGVCVPKLMLKFYGVPSPHRRSHFEQSNQKRIVSPLVYTVPLLLEDVKSSEEENVFGHNPYSSLAAEIPSQILFSDDETIGVAFLRNPTGACAWTSSEMSQDEDTLGTIVIFEMPSIINHDSGLVRTYRCSNIRIGGWNSYTMRNSLWSSTFIPAKEMKSSTEKEQNNGDAAVLNQTTYTLRKALSAYVLFNDEDDGFRISWITPFSLVSWQSSYELQHKSCSIRPSRRDIVYEPDDQVWETNVSSSLSGQVHQNLPERDGSGRLAVAFELYLNVDALLSDVLGRRRRSSIFGISPYQNDNVHFMPEFCYDLVSVEADGMEVTVVVVFNNREKMMHSQANGPSAMGVFVRISLYDQSYDELQWVSSNGAHSMKRWCMTLALNWRMKEKRVGIFCTSLSDSFPSWVCETHDHNCDDDLLDDVNTEMWTEYAMKRNSAEKKKSILAPKAVSMSSLFPGCHITSNRAVQTAVPLIRLSSHSPTEVIYR